LGIAERLEAWRLSGVTTLLCITSDLRTVQAMAELVC